MSDLEARGEMRHLEPERDNRSDGQRGYSSPSVTVIGTVTDLTLGPKVFNATDGASMFGVPEGFGS